jgi:hypothetical protein
MKLVGTIVGALMIMLGAVWTLQGANVLAGSVISGQSQWLYIGIVAVLTGAALIYFLRRPARPRL